MNPFKSKASDTSGGEAEYPSPGTHAAVCVGLVDLGTHEGEYQGQPREDRKVLFAWELSDEVRSDNQPFVMVADYNVMPDLSRKSKLRLMLESWRSRPFNDQDDIDLTKTLGAPCLLNLEARKTKDGKEYVRIKDVIPAPKNATIAKPQYEPFAWSDLGQLPRLPDWLPFLYGKQVEKHIEESLEARGIAPKVRPNANGNGHPANPDAEDPEDPPF